MARRIGIPASTIPELINLDPFELYEDLLLRFTESNDVRCDSHCFDMVGCAVEQNPQWAKKMLIPELRRINVVLEAVVIPTTPNFTDDALLAFIHLCSHNVCHKSQSDVLYRSFHQCLRAIVYNHSRDNTALNDDIYRAVFSALSNAPPKLLSGANWWVSAVNDASSSAKRVTILMQMLHIYPMESIKSLAALLKAEPTLIEDNDLADIMVIILRTKGRSEEMLKELASMLSTTELINRISETVAKLTEPNKDGLRRWEQSRS
ncbi:MAG: hypothetical protein Q8O87_01530 [bacterium]|nr:hypothetical protein [bacterium]